MYYTIYDERTGYDSRIPDYGLVEFSEPEYGVSLNRQGEPRLHISIRYGKNLKSYGTGWLGPVPLDTKVGDYSAYDLPPLLTKPAPMAGIENIKIDRKTGSITYDWISEWDLGGVAKSGRNGYIRVEYLVFENVWKTYYLYQPILKRVRTRNEITLRFRVVPNNRLDLRYSDWLYFHLKY